MKRKLIRGIIVATIVTTVFSITACSDDSSNKSSENQEKVVVNDIEKEPGSISKSGSIKEIVSGETISEKDNVIDFNDRGIFTTKVEGEKFEVLDKGTGKSIIELEEGYTVLLQDHVFCFEDGSAVWTEAKVNDIGVIDDNTWSLKHRDIDGNVTVIDKSEKGELTLGKDSITYPVTLSANKENICYSLISKVDGKPSGAIKLYNIKSKETKIIASVSDYENKIYSADMGKDYIAYNVVDSNDMGSKKIYIYSIKTGKTEELNSDYSLSDPKISDRYLVASLKKEGAVKEYWIYSMDKKEWVFRVTPDSKIFDKLKSDSTEISFDKFIVKGKYLVINYLGKSNSFIIVDMDSEKSYNPEEILDIEPGNKDLNLSLMKFANSDSQNLIWSRTENNENMEFKITKLK